MRDDNILIENTLSIFRFFSRRVNSEVRSFVYETSKGMRKSCLMEGVTAETISKFRWKDVLGQSLLYCILYIAV